MSKPFISVIIPAYNAEKHIEKGLSSIKAQSFTDYELIVICDSCVDRTEEIAKRYGAVTDVVEYNRDGLTRDHGIRLARGEWILFMDDDDWYLHEYCFQQLADRAGKYGEDVLAFSYIWKSRGYIRNTPELYHNPGYATVWSKLWRRAAIGDAYFGNARFCSDTYFMKRMIQRTDKVEFWDMPMYYYNFMHEGSQTDNLVHGKTFMSVAAKY